MYKFLITKISKVKFHFLLFIGLVNLLLACNDNNSYSSFCEICKKELCECEQLEEAFTEWNVNSVNDLPEEEQNLLKKYNGEDKQQLLAIILETYQDVKFKPTYKIQGLHALWLGSQKYDSCLPLSIMTAIKHHVTQDTKKNQLQQNNKEEQVNIFIENINNFKNGTPYEIQEGEGERTEFGLLIEKEINLLRFKNPNQKNPNQTNGNMKISANDWRMWARLTDYEKNKDSVAWDQIYRPNAPTEISLGLSKLEYLNRPSSHYAYACYSEDNNFPIVLKNKEICNESLDMNIKFIIASLKRNVPIIIGANPYKNGETYGGHSSLIAGITLNSEVNKVRKTILEKIKQTKSAIQKTQLAFNSIYSGIAELLIYPNNTHSQIKYMNMQNQDPNQPAKCETLFFGDDGNVYDRLGGFRFSMGSNEQFKSTEQYKEYFSKTGKQEHFVVLNSIECFEPH